VTLDIFDQQMPNSTRIRVHSKGIGSLAVVEAKVEFSATDDGTRLDWSAEIQQLGGLLRPVSRDLIAVTAQKVIQDGWVEFRKALA
jgi:carbon monoxide dehydrogenase subunit G